MTTILITGGSGTVGTSLIQQLRKKDVALRILSRSKEEIPAATVFTWDVNEGQLEEGALDNVDHIIHLAGANVSQRWTAVQRKKIRDSRIKSADLLFEKLGDRKLKSFISASGISIYGTRTSEHIFTESDSPDYYDNDFLAQVSVDWEKAADQFTSRAERVVKIRTPIVLSRTEGALEKMAKPIKMGLGAPLGSGKQYTPWVHIDDLCKAYIKAVEDEQMNGIYNVVAPEHLTNKQLTQAIARVLNKKLWLPNVPAFMLKLIYGKMAEIVLKGSRASGEKITDLGFEYDYKVVEQALKDLLTINNQ
ncbi:MAG: TIGR01777 family oxidoreductase [Crocinitomicaceae bacterium]